MKPLKHGVLVLAFLTLIATLLPLYSNWSESRRQNQIRAIKQQQRPVIGNSLEVVLTELKSGGEQPAVVILYTGGTKSHLEPCGCYQEQSGGLPRRAYLMEQIRLQEYPTLVVDAGDIFNGTQAIDAQRCQVNLKAMSAMRYDAVALSQKERYFDPGCVSCHTTGFAYPTGFEIGDSTSTLKGVQCETCHGPGKQHIDNPKKTNIRRGNDTALCLTCHDLKHSPGFAEVAALHTKDVDHSRDPMNLEELLKSRMARMGKPTLELFVMSYCPFGIQAEEKLFPIVKKLGDKIDFKLQFIAQEKEELTSQDTTPFTSLHGYPEVTENIRQLLIAKEYPDQYLDYILCRGKKLNESWTICAQKFNIDVEKIQALFDTPDAEQHFRKNIKRAAELDIRASPTILVDTHEFQSNQLLRSFGIPCQ